MQKKISVYRAQVNEILAARGRSLVGKDEIIMVNGEDVFVWGVKKGINAWTAACTIINMRCV